MGHKKGTTVDVATPRGVVKYKIESIKSSAPKKAAKKAFVELLDELGKTEAALVAARRENLAALRSRGNDPFARARFDVRGYDRRTARALRVSRPGPRRKRRRLEHRRPHALEAHDGQDELRRPCRPQPESCRFTCVKKKSASAPSATGAISTAAIFSACAATCFARRWAS